MESYSEVPIGIGLIVCDTIIEDKMTGKKSLIGLFSQIHPRRLPCYFNSMSVLVALTGGNGTYPFDLVCQHAASDEVAFKLSCKIDFKSPLQVLDLVFQLKNVKFTHTGQYWLKALIDDIPIMMRPLAIVPKTPDTPKPPPPPHGGDDAPPESGPQKHRYPGPEE